VSGRPRAIVVAARRTAIGALGGIHRRVSVEKLAAPVIRAILADASLQLNAVDALVMGNAASGGGNPARLALLEAGLPHSIPASTIDTQCASGLDAIAAGARLIETGAAEAVIAGGAESASTAPWRIAKPANLYRELPAFYSEAPFAPSGLGNPSMIEGAEAVARYAGISRERQDAYALLSHQRASALEARARAKVEIVSVSGGEEADESVRPAISARLLARMRPLIEGGSVTAGNACAISDGAAFALLLSERAFQASGLSCGRRWRDAASAGCDPALPGLSAIPAVKALLARHPSLLEDATSIAFVEAFASQVLASADAHGLAPERINNHGGALALGHPYGASGAILTVQLFTEMVRCANARAQGLGLAMAAGAGGTGAAAICERVP
jgi:acetyl-CoA C-acetyltransferase